MLSGGAQRRVLPRRQSEEMKILNILIPRVGIETTTYRAIHHDSPHFCRNYDFNFNKTCPLQPKLNTNCYNVKD